MHRRARWGWVLAAAGLLPACEDFPPPAAPQEPSAAQRHGPAVKTTSAREAQAARASTPVSADRSSEPHAQLQTRQPGEPPATEVERPPLSPRQSQVTPELAETARSGEESARPRADGRLTADPGEPPAAVLEDADPTPGPAAGADTDSDEEPALDDDRDAQEVGGQLDDDSVHLVLGRQPSASGGDSSRPVLLLEPGTVEVEDDASEGAEDDD